jgi:4-hydroxy-4-methyl-2-oxoglutarate aldolase
LPVLSPVGDNLQLHHAVYVAEPGDVLVVDTCDTDEFGYWGEILAIAALQRGIAGLVISGGVRDAPALCRLDFPTFAANICIRGTSKNPDLGGSICDPVRLGDVTVNRGDLVVGDADGVVVISADEAKIVVDKALQREHEEEKIFRRLRAGETTLAIYGLPAVKGAK